MNIHSNTVDYFGIMRAASAAGCSAEVEEFQSRSASNGFRVYLSGSSPRAQNRCNAHGYRDQAATWDEWGMFFAALYLIDPSVIVGSSRKNAIYSGVRNFDLKTEHRFASVRPADMVHKTHKWIMNESGWTEIRYPEGVYSTKREKYVRRGLVCSHPECSATQPRLV